MLKNLSERLPFDRLKSGLAAYRSNPKLCAYVALVSLGGVVLLVLHAGSTPPTSLRFLLWFVFSFIAELLWLDTPTGEATDSMASTFNVAVLYLFGCGLSLWIIGLSVLLATRFVQKRDWVKSIFGLGQMVITSYLAGMTFVLLAGGAGSIEHFHSVRGVGALLAVCVVYYAVNTWLVSGAVALASGTPVFKIWRVNYAYKNAILSSAALFALSPILLLSYLTLSYPGVLLFFLPLVIVKNQNREYIELQRATQALISSERMAAKGEMAASVAHEMNNYLAVLSGRTQLLQRKFEKAGLTEMKRDGEILWTQVERLSRMARGLLDFSHRELKVTQFDLNALCRELVEFLQPQNAFDQVRLETDLLPELDEVEGDAGQIHQILLNLCKNAADAMRDAETLDRHVWIRTSEDARGYIRVVVEDNGPGVPAAIRQRIFEPGFTTKRDGHGFGLATTYRIVENHKGRIWVEDRSGGGGRFVLTWPAGRQPGNTSTQAA
jgi:signal transduction histidine kinase